MKRMQLIAVALCLIMLLTVGASAVAAKQTENPRQAGSSHIYFYDVAPTDGHGKGKLQINLDKHTFVFNGQGFEPSAQVALRARAADNADYVVFATGKATPSGNMHIAGTWEAAVAPANVVASDQWPTIDSAILYQFGRLTVTGSANTGLSLTLVSVSHPTEAIATTKGDPTGHYTLSGISADTEQALWRYPYMKFAIVDAEGNTLATTTTLTIVNGVLTLDPPTSDPIAGHDFTLTGKLTYANGQPLPQGDAGVWFYQLGRGEDFGPATTFDPATGAYSYTVKGGLPAGSYSIEASAFNALTGIITGPDSTPITVTVQPG